MWVKTIEVFIVTNDNNINLRALGLKVFICIYIGNKTPLWFVGQFESI